MKYIKLTALPNTWYKEGTEVYWQDHDHVCRRPTEDEWETVKTDGGWWGAVFRGTRICQSIHELGVVGVEYDDGEICSIDEFKVEVVDEPFIYCKL